MALLVVVVFIRVRFNRAVVFTISSGFCSFVLCERILQITSFLPRRTRSVSLFSSSDCQIFSTDHFLMFSTIEKLYSKSMFDILIGWRRWRVQKAYNSVWRPNQNWSTPPPFTRFTHVSIECCALISPCGSPMAYFCGAVDRTMKRDDPQIQRKRWHLDLYFCIEQEIHTDCTMLAPERRSSNHLQRDRNSKRDVQLCQRDLPR